MVLHQENIFRFVNLCILAVGDVDGRTGILFNCTCPRHTVTATDILMGVANICWQIGLGRWAHIVLLPNVGLRLNRSPLHCVLSNWSKAKWYLFTEKESCNLKIKISDNIWQNITNLLLLGSPRYRRKFCNWEHWAWLAFLLHLQTFFTAAVLHGAAHKR